eukprot:4251256-Prymnesium_polylepis.1
MERCHHRRHPPKLESGVSLVGGGVSTHVHSGTVVNGTLHLLTGTQSRCKAGCPFDGYLVHHTLAGSVGPAFQVKQWQERRTRVFCDSKPGGRGGRGRVGWVYVGCDTLRHAG